MQYNASILLTYQITTTQNIVRPVAIATDWVCRGWIYHNGWKTVILKHIRNTTSRLLYSCYTRRKAPRTTEYNNLYIKVWSELICIKQRVLADIFRAENNTVITSCHITFTTWAKKKHQCLQRFDLLCNKSNFCVVSLAKLSVTLTA